MATRRLSPPRTDPVQPRRVVVTGIGLVLPLGVGADVSWRRLVGGDVAVHKIDDEVWASFFSDVSPEGRARFLDGVKTIATVPRAQFHPATHCPAIAQREKGRLNDVTLFALAAAQEAIGDAALDISREPDRFRVGVAIGSGVGGLNEVSAVEKCLLGLEGSKRRIDPHFVSKLLTNTPASSISRAFQIHGPNLCNSTACSAGAHSIGEAFSWIRWGGVDVMLAGGAESAHNKLAFSGFNVIRALARWDGPPEEASRPFDEKRCGFVMGEGAAILVLEELQHAQHRGAQIYAEVRGYSATGDAYHVVEPHPLGEGALMCMKNALRDANLREDEINYVNAHATSTPKGDTVELSAIRRLFGDHAVSPSFCVSSTKGAIGHLLGGAGAAEAAFTILAIAKNCVPPTANLHHCDIGDPPGHGIDLVRSVEATRVVQAALSNSFGFGGTNASLAFAKLMDV